MSAGPPGDGPGADGHGFRHGAAVVDSDEALFAAVLPFLDEGLRAGELVALACTPPTAELITRALGQRATAVRSDTSLTLLGSRPPDAFAAAGRYAAEAESSGAGRLRVVADIDFGPHPLGWREGQRFESVANRLMKSAPVSAICVYDRRRLPGPVVDSAAATHPEMVDAAGWWASPRYQEPARYVPALPIPREPVEDGPPVFSVDDAPTLAGLRHQLKAVIAARVPDPDQQEELHLAVSEIAANAFRHGVRPVSARVWAARERIVCVISDRGTSFGDPFAGFVPARGMDLSRGGMGLWLARKLWDHVDVLSSEQGLSIRLSARLR